MAIKGEQRRSGFVLEDTEMVLSRSSSLFGVAAHSGTSFVTHRTKNIRAHQDGDWFRVAMAGYLTGANNNKIPNVNLHWSGLDVDISGLFGAAEVGHYSFEVIGVHDAGGAWVYIYYRSKGPTTDSVATQQVATVPSEAYTINVESRVVNAADSISVLLATIECGGTA